MILRHDEKTVNDYFGRVGMNQSSLKVLLFDGVQAYEHQKNDLMRQNDLYYEEKTYFLIGQAVDTYLTMGQDAFREKFYISNLIKKPSDTMMSIVKFIFDTLLGEFRTHSPEAEFTFCLDEEEVQPFIIQSIAEHEYQSKWKLETKVKKVIEDGSLYWDDLKAAQGKQVLSDTEGKMVHSIVISITTHKHTANLFKDSEDIDIVFQFPMYFDFKNVDCKCLVDMIIINHSIKKIIPIDIKTVGDYILKFNRAVKHRRYDIQGAFYTCGLDACRKELGAAINKDVTDYSIANFAFIAESTKFPGTPIICVLTPELLLQGRYGKPSANGFKEVLGFEQGIQLFKDWTEYEFSITKRFAETNGVLHITDEFDYTQSF